MKNTGWGAVWALVMMASLAACGDRASSSLPPLTASRALDAGEVQNLPDAGKEVRDGGHRFDGGHLLDGGQGLDAGPGLDGGSGVDAGADLDGGGELDAGEELDAGGGLDAGAGGPDAGPTSGTAQLIYSQDRTQSPIDDVVASGLRAVAARGTGRPGVFSKVGDSVSFGYAGVTGSSFLNCFDGVLEGTTPGDVNIRLGSNAVLAPSIGYFKSTPLGSGTSWSRVSLAVRVGRTAGWATAGTPSPIDQELSAVNPRFAVVLYGSNDIGWGGQGPYPVANQAQTYERAMRLLTDELLARGVVPLLNTMPPDRSDFAFTPVFSAVVRGIAQGRQVPLIDLHKALLALGPPYGLRTDGTHPSYADYNTACWFDAASLARHGANVRNLITLEALDRMRQIFDQTVTTLDFGAPRVQGDGSSTTPFVIDQVPWGELRDLRTSPFRPVGSLSCAGAPPVAGPQNLYRLVLSRPMSLRVLVLDGGQNGQRVSLLSGPDLSSCLKTDQRLITATLSAGTYYLVVNAQGTDGGAEYNLSVSECIPNDPDC